MEDTELDPSELGTQSYWQKAYIKEIANFEENGDPGDVWFGEDSAYRVIEWICECGKGRETAVVDIGCGNGYIIFLHMISGCGNGYTLTELAREGFTTLLGIDYCEEAISLADKVSKKEFPEINYKVFDITKDDVTPLGKFGIVHDKGTYDAISLNPENPKHHREKYIEQVALMLDEEGLYIITSCNWTEEELIRQFSEKLALKCVIPTPQFKFGGKVGNVVSSVVFCNK